MTATVDATDRSTVEQLIATVEDLRDTVEQQAEQIDELREELADHKDHTGREFADVRGRITDVEERVESIEETSSSDVEPGISTERTGSQNTETPLERICALPEPVADRELTANQERARFIARDIHDYAEKAPAGLVIDSSTIKKVITARKESSAHNQTVSRVMDFLDDLGKEDVRLKKRRGKNNILVIDPEAAEKYHGRCDSGMDPTLLNGVTIAR